MRFTSIVDLIKYFVNEYSKPGGKALLIGMVPEIMEIKRIFYFVDNELTIRSNENQQYGEFDIIVNLNNEEIVQRGTMLTVNKSVGIIETYYLFEKKYYVIINNK